MAQQTQFWLPRGATGLDAFGFAIHLGRDKVVFIRKGDREHYTLQFGSASGIIDVHRTWTERGGRKCHETLFAIRREMLDRAVVEAMPHLTELFGLRKLRFSWLRRRGIIIVKGLMPVTGGEIAAVGRITNRRKRLEITEESIREKIQVMESVDELLLLPDCAFTLFAGRRMIGIGFKATDPHGKARFAWAPLSEIARSCSRSRVGELFLRRLLEHALPCEQSRGPAAPPE